MWREDSRFTVCPVKTAVKPACFRDRTDFIWEGAVLLRSGGFGRLNEVTTGASKHHTFIFR